MALRALSRAAVLLLALGVAGTARAVVGGAPETGPLARTSAMILSSDGGVCSAVVLAPDVLLTAAHCASGAREHRGHYRGDDGEPVLLPVAEKIVHPGFDRDAIKARRRSIDLALVRLGEPLPARFSAATLAPASPDAGEAIVLGGYGAAVEGEARTTGTFRTARLGVVEPHGRSSILIWAADQGTGRAGACLGDSGGPIAVGERVIAITTWSSGHNGRACGHFSQGVLVGPQRDWIDRTLARWGRTARWDEDAR